MVPSKSVILILVATLLGIIKPAAAQAEEQFLFLARTDNNADGFVDSNDNTILFHYDGTEVFALSDSSTENIFSYDYGHDNLTVAKLSVIDTISTVSVISTLDGTLINEFVITDLSQIRTEYVQTKLWVIGNAVDGIPVVRLYDTVSGQMLAERSTRRANTRVQVAVNGQYALVFNAEAVAISVYQAPTLESVQFSLTGLGGISPIWLNETQFIIGSRRDNNPSDLYGQIVNVATLETTEFDLPDLDQGIPITWESSPDGRHVLIRADDSNQTDYRLVNVQSGQVSDLINPSGIYSVETWSADSRFLALRLNDTAKAIAIWDTTTQLFVSLGNYDIYSLTWHPELSLIGFVARDMTMMRFGIFAADLSNPAVDMQTYYSSTESSIASSRIQFSIDSPFMYFSAPSGDLITTPGGVARAIFKVDIQGGFLTRISPANLDVLVDQ